MLCTRSREAIDSKQGDRKKFQPLPSSSCEVDFTRVETECEVQGPTSIIQKLLTDCGIAIDAEVSNQMALRLKFRLQYPSHVDAMSGLVEDPVVDGLPRPPLPIQKQRIGEDKDPLDAHAAAKCQVIDLHALQTRGILPVGIASDPGD